MQKIEKFFIFDVSAMMYKAYFAMQRTPMKTSQGINVSAIHGVANQILAVITKELPDYLAIAYDSKEKTFRHEQYPEYKANRAKMPDDLTVQIPVIKEMLSAMSLPAMEMPGWEADDIIGTTLEKIKSEKMHLYIVSGDKDFMQLVNDQCSLYTVKKGEEPEIISYAEVYKKFNCRPDQVVDVLAMMGDAADNVPGIPGVGEKTAMKYIELYGSLENLYHNVSDIKGSLHDKIVNGREKAFLSRELVTIQRNCPIEFDLNQLRFELQQLTKKEEIYQICREYEFKNLGERIKNISNGNFKKTPSTTPLTATEEKKEAAHTTQEPSRKKKENKAPSEDITFGSSYNEKEVNYHIIKNLTEWEECCNRLRASNFLVVDTETDGLDCIENELAGLSFAIQEKEAWYLPVNYPDFTENATTRQIVMTQVKEILENPNIKKCGQNIKFDYRTLMKEDIRISPIAFDTMVASHLVNQDRVILSLDDLALQYFDYKKIPTEAVIGQGIFEVKMTEVPAESVYLYACEDADITFRLAKELDKELTKLEMQNLFQNIEMPLIPVLAEMEQIGVYVDASILKELEKDFEVELARLTKAAHEIAGESFNLDSPKELGYLLFEKLEVHKKVGYKPKKNKIGYSTSADVLEQLLPEPLPATVAEYRTLKKLQSTYVRALPEMIHKKTNRIHSRFNQFIVQTGRLSSDSPNLQNIPIRGSEGRKIRKAFKAQSNDYCFVSADYSQIELRVLAHLSQDEHMLEAFKSSADIHTSTAAKIFNKTPETVTKEDRSKAKAINFGIIYGMGAKRLAKDNNITLKEATTFIENYKATFPKIDVFFQTKIDEAKKTNYVSTFFGRKRLSDRIHLSGYEGAMEVNVVKNTPIQGTAAEIIKLAMIQIHKKIEQEKLPMTLIGQVHDELLFEVKKDFAQKAKEIIKETMSSVVKWDVDLVVEVGIGDNWLDAH